MRTWVKRLRGVIGTATIWGLAWFGVSLAFWSTKLFGLSALELGLAVGSAAGVGLAGAITGACFAVVVGIAERRRSFAELTMPRMAVWGAIAGTPLALAVVAEVSFAEWAICAAALGLLGACSSAASLTLARSANGSLGERDNAPALPPGTSRGIQ